MPRPDEIATTTRRLESRVREVARETHVDLLAYLSTSRKRVLAKREDLQVTGSFKVRGAAAKLATLSQEELRRGVIAASTGNHGLAVAHAASLSGTNVTVFVPEGANTTKIDRLRAAGATVELVPGNAVAAERTARRVAEETGAVYVSPYNDMAVVAGQGTIGLELSRQVDDSFTLVASVGGGGLISGTAANLSGRTVSVVGTSPVVDAAMAASVAAGRVVDVAGGPTLSDGTAGDLERDAITLALCTELVDRWELQPESAIAAALERHREETGVVVEGSAALALATAARLDVEGVVVVVICGGNA